jgi:starch phosphorylase
MTANPAKALDLPQGFGNGSISFAGTESALYERHLIFDREIDPKIATARERFEAFSRSVRDILAEHWVLTKSTHERENAKRIYYLSMEILIGRSLANNVSVARSWAKKWRKPSRVSTKRSLP